MTTRIAYFWGPMSSFAAELVSWLLHNGWTVHVPTKSAFHISLSPLDLRSTVESSCQRVLGLEKRVLAERLVLLDAQEIPKGVHYDILVFCGLPPNPDEPRVSRAPWAADELKTICQRLKSVPAIVVSSLWAGIQQDGVVPEEVEFERRKPHSHYEAICQQYEQKIVGALEACESLWHLVRLPLITGKLGNGFSLGFTGLAPLLERLSSHPGATLEVPYNPDATFWMLPSDVSAKLVGQLIADPTRPRICNLVSTQARLNQEWLPDLAQACDLEGIINSEKDTLSLPGTLKSMLTDNIQVRTRNLFELLGRHHNAPIVMDKEYFKRLVEFGRAASWGHLKKSEEDFSSEAAERYFLKFLPERINANQLKAVASFKGGIVFSIGSLDHSWILSAGGNQAEVKLYDPVNDSPAVRIVIQPHGFARLVENRIAFEYALISKTLRAEGKALESLKALDLFKRFLKDNTFINANGTVPMIKEQKV